MYRKNILVLFISLFVSILCSCGVINDSAPKRDVYSGETTCSMNTAKLQKILEEDIQEAIDCIEQNFVRVSQQVKIQNGKHIQKNELFKLTTRLLPADGHLIVQKALSLLFKINSIFLKDEADRLSVENIKPFFDIIRVVNKEGVHLNRIFKEINNENNKRSFWRLRAEFIQSVTNISQKSLNIQKDSKKEVSLNIEEFAQELDENLRNTDLKVEKIVSLNFIKKLFLGGDRNILTSTELKELFQKAPDLLTVLFDTYFVKDTDFSHAIEKDRFLLEKVNQIEGLIHQGSEDEILFTIKDLINANEKLLESLKENYVKKYAKTIGTLKINLLTQSIKERDTEDPNKFSLKNIKKIISLAKEYFEIQYFYKLAFNQFEDLMSVPLALTTDVTKDKATYRVINKKMPSSLSDHIFTPEQNNKLWLNFLHIITNNRLYRDKNDLVPFYWDTYKRTKKGLVETAVIRWGLGQLFPKFGYLSPKSMRDNIIPGPKYILDDDRIWTALTK